MDGDRQCTQPPEYPTADWLSPYTQIVHHFLPFQPVSIKLHISCDMSGGIIATFRLTFAERGIPSCSARIKSLEWHPASLCPLSPNVQSYRIVRLFLCQRQNYKLLCYLAQCFIINIITKYFFPSLSLPPSMSPRAGRGASPGRSPATRFKSKALQLSLSKKFWSLKFSVSNQHWLEQGQVLHIVRAGVC